MSEGSVDPEVIKRTQDTLGKIIAAPALTDKLLSRPPVQFIQDIVKAIIKKTGFLQGLYSDEELSTSYLKEGRENKTLFMKKLVTAIYIAVKRSPDARVSKILAGQEADKTNLMLQALAEAINAKVKSDDIVRTTLRSIGEGDENEGGTSERPSERSRDRKQDSSENPGTSSSTDRLKSSRGDRKSASNEGDDSGNAVDRRASSKETSRNDQADSEGNQSKRRRSARVNDDAGGSSHDDRRDSSAVAHQKDDDDSDQDKKDHDEDMTRRRSSRPSSAKGPRKHQKNNEQTRAASPKEQPTRVIPPSHTSASTDRDHDDKRPIARPGTASAAKGRKPMKSQGGDEVNTSSGRIASAAQRVQGSLIVESKDGREKDMDDDDDENFLIQEDKTTASKSLRIDDPDGRDDGQEEDANGAQHGALVNNMYKLQKQMEHGSEIAGQRADVKTINQNEAERRRERQNIQKDVEKLRETIQTLTKSVVPLGKILEYLQEDYETMAKEMQQYNDEYKRTVVDLRREKLTTDQTLEPLRRTLVDLDEQIGDMKTRIVFMKKKISTTEKANAARLLEIIRHTK